jgi:hypothetical protein
MGLDGGCAALVTIGPQPGDDAVETHRPSSAT